MSIPFRVLGRGAGRSVPWIRYLALARQILRRGQGAYAALSPGERQTLARIVRDSGGRPGRVSPGDRAELQRLVRKAIGGAARPR